MAHTDRFCAENNDKLIEYLKNKGIIKSSIVTKTMCLVDRKNYVGSSNRLNNEQYTDAPLKISHNRTISSPHMHGMIFEILAEKLSTAKNVLCIRCNTGYVSSCMASMMGPHGTVFHIESIPDLKEKVKKTIKKTNPYLLWTKRMQLLDVENESAGYPQPKVRYDVIYVGAAAAEIPQALIDQLAYGGRLVIPIGPKDLQQLMQIDKNLDGTIVKKTVTSVRYEYLDSPREITNANNNTEIKAENDSNKTSISNLNTVCLNNLISEKVQTQSSTEIPNRSPTKPVKNHFNNNCMKDHLLQTIADKFETKTDEIYAQPSVKDPEENVHKILQDIRTLMTKLELQYDSRSVEKIKDTQEKATSNDRSSESRISHETKMQNTSAIKPVQKKDEVLSITKEKLNNKNDEADTQSSIKESEENIHKTLQESQTLEEKLVLDSKDDPRNIEEIEDTQEKSRPDSSSESRIFHEIMKAQSSVNELSKQAVRVYAHRVNIRCVVHHRFGAQHILSLFIPQNLFCSGILFPEKEKKMQIWRVVLVGALCLGASNALECYVCKNQEGNIEKCLNTIKTCEQGEDTCLSEIKWGSTPYWNQGAKKQFYISKRCSTKRECERIRRANMPDCSHIWYQDWKCSECCQGDRCNYYIVSGTDKVGTTVMMFLFPLFAIWILQ